MSYSLWDEYGEVCFYANISGSYATTQYLLKSKNKLILDFINNGETDHPAELSAALKKFVKGKPPCDQITIIKRLTDGLDKCGYYAFIPE